VSLKDFTEKIKSFYTYLHNIEKETFFVIMTVVLISINSFYLGALNNLTNLQKNQSGIEIEQGSFVIDFEKRQNNIENSENNSENVGKTIVASKNGTKYYPIACSGANRIKEENKIYFASTDLAEKAGYEPSSACF
jgi:hypothetical protein